VAKSVLYMQEFPSSFAAIRLARVMTTPITLRD
jgi:hypothetical protein